MTEPIRIAIAGAGGRIGYSLVFRIANGGLFGQEQPVALSLLELPDALPRLEACAMELHDCAFPLLADLRFGSDPLRMFAGADWAILAGGKPFRPDVRVRFDLLRDNAPIMIDHARAINQVAPTARVLVVVNPSNTNTLIAMSQAPNVPPNHWFAINHFLRMRAMAALAEKVGVPVTQITRLTVWGNNSETAYIDLGNTRIGNQPALDVISDADWIRNVFEPKVGNRGREIMKLSGTTPAASIAHAILTTIRAINTPTPFEHWFGAGVVSDGSYGVPRGLIFGFPLLTADGKSWSIAQGHYLDIHGQEHIAQNVAELEHEASVVSHLLAKT